MQIVQPKHWWREQSIWTPSRTSRVVGGADDALPDGSDVRVCEHIKDGQSSHRRTGEQGDAHTGPRRRTGETTSATTKVSEVDVGVGVVVWGGEYILSRGRAHGDTHGTQMWATRSGATQVQTDRTGALRMQKSPVEDANFLSKFFFW